MSKEITSRDQDYSQWYNDLVIKGGLADYSAVRGCMVIKPNGFALWENMRDALDKMFKDTGHVNAYFPLVYTQKLFKQGSGPCGRLCQGMRRGNALPFEERSKWRRRDG